MAPWIRKSQASPASSPSASGPRVDAMAGLIAPVLRTSSARLRTHRLEGAVVAVVLAWAAVGAMTALGWL